MTKYTDEQKKKNMLAKMVMRRNVGEKYTPKEKIYSGIFRNFKKIPSSRGIEYSSIFRILDSETIGN